MVLDILSKNYSDLQAVKDDITFQISLSTWKKWEFTLIARSYESLTPGLMTFLERKCAYVGLNFTANKIPKETSLKQFCFNYNLSDIKFETLLRICDVTSSKSRVQ
jgi:hypothetical protein